MQAALKRQHVEWWWSTSVANCWRPPMLIGPSSDA